MSTLFGLNALLCATFGLYPKYWYVFLFALGLGTFMNSLSAVMLMVKSLMFVDKRLQERTEARKILYLVPCYNESYEELYRTINSLVDQYHIVEDERSILIVCDGRVRGTGTETERTDIILKRLLDVVDNEPVSEIYHNAAGRIVRIDIYTGSYRSIKFMLMIKEENQGKRDSVTLARRLVLTPHIMKSFAEWAPRSPDYIIGVDADTLFGEMCANELLKRMEAEDNVSGTVGLVDIKPKWNIFVMYQFAEYHYGQFLRRRVQSEITGKVNCLSGCNQIIRVCRETCGDELLNKFNRVPEPNENIFSHIRSYASEDRNHVCLMLSMYPNVKTAQNLHAVCFTGVPESVSVFLSQRRRWTLGALSNDLLLTYLPGINLFERCSAIVNLLTFSFNVFITVATGFFAYAIATSANRLMLYLSIPMIIPFVYCLLYIPIARGFYARETLYFYASFLVYLTLGLPVSLIIHIYSILGMDTLKWGKTRLVSRSGVAGADVFTGAPLTFYIDDESEAMPVNKVKVNNSIDIDIELDRDRALELDRVLELDRDRAFNTRETDV